MPGHVGGTPHLTLRAILFLVWLVLGNDWLTRHMGVGLTGQLLPIAAALGILGTGFAGLEAATGEKLKEKWLGKIVEKLLKPRVLVGLYAALVVAMAGWSSVTILNDPANTVFEATLTSADSAGGAGVQQDNKGAPGNPVQFNHVWVGALGRPYRLVVKGYLPQMFEVYPIAGVALSPRKDLRLTPSVLLRPPFEALPAMTGGVRIVAWMEDTRGSNKRQILPADQMAGKQSILIGSEQPIPQAWLDKWRVDALAHRITNESLLAQLQDSWKQALVAAPLTPLEPGQVLRAVVCNPNRQTLAEARSLLSEDRFQDVAMQPATTTPYGNAHDVCQESHL